MNARLALLLSSLATAASLGYYGAPFALPRADKRPLLPGATSPGHRLIESACSECHTPFGGVDSDACRRCHEPALTNAEDSHPESKFVDPRNADRAFKLDARSCVTCHREHEPRRTREGGVTLPADFCRACHEDVGRERASHASFEFSTCASTGCHRFHDNRNTYESFLAKHLHEPEVLPDPRVPVRPAPKESARVEPDPPAGVTAEPPLVAAWKKSAHARAGVACTPCHGVEDAGMLVWKDRPGGASCKSCHASEQEGYTHGKHGMRDAVGLSPLTPDMALLPMRADARDKALSCDACHGAHDYDTRRAAVEACLGCHDDQHSRAYTASRHYLLWQRELRGEGAPGTGVSCATCHMPRVAVRTHGVDVVRVEHDQSDNLRPVDKMVRSVCLSCHGLGFAVDALADRALAARNFNGRPAAHVASSSMVEGRTWEGGTKK
jgi:hypothetical protein